MQNKSCFTPAFTAVEALMSMAVTAIILSVIYVIFSFTSMRIADLRQRNESVTDLNRFSYSINKGIFECATVAAGASQLSFIDSEGSPTTFSFGDSLALRLKGDFTDTFHFTVRRFRIDTLRSPSGKVVFQRLYFAINADGPPIDMSFYRRLCATDMLKPSVYEL